MGVIKNHPVGKHTHHVTVALLPGQFAELDLEQVVGTDCGDKLLGG